MPENLDTARTGENFAASHLESLGYEILERNYRYGRGEIDIIARDGGATVFIEVKTRTNDRFGAPESSVTRSKQRQLARVATGWLLENGFPDAPCRFDVLAITWEKGVPVFNLIQHAFTLGL